MFNKAGRIEIVDFEQMKKEAKKRQKKAENLH